MYEKLFKASNKTDLKPDDQPEDPDSGVAYARAKSIERGMPVEQANAIFKTQKDYEIEVQKLPKSSKT